MNEIVVLVAVVIVVVEGLIEKVVVVVGKVDVISGVVEEVVEVRAVVVLLVVLDVGIILVVVVNNLGLIVKAIFVVPMGRVSSIAVVEDILVTLSAELVCIILRKVKGVVWSFAVVVVAVLGTVEETVEETMEEGLGEREMEEWDTYGSLDKFLSSTTLGSLEGSSTCLPKDVCVFV